MPSHSGAILKISPMPFAIIYSENYPNAIHQQLIRFQLKTLFFYTRVSIFKI
jgi:hypothetical protein